MEYYHLGEMVHRQAEKYKTKSAFKVEDPLTKTWSRVSWSDFSDDVMKAARAMAEIGVEPTDNVGTYSQNMYKYLVTDFASYANRAVTVSMYATASPSQIEFIIEEANIKLLFVGEQFQYNNAYKVQSSSSCLKKIVVYDNSVVLHPEDKTTEYFDKFLFSGENSISEALVNSRMSELNEKDLATIIYTSGTTGVPKGVMLPHSVFEQLFKIHDMRLTWASDKDVSMCFLPLAHIFEKAWSYFSLHKAMCIAVNLDPRRIQQTIKQVRPTIMASVPRFWEKVYDGVTDKIESSTGLAKWLFNDAIKTGKKHNLDYVNEGKTPPLGTRIKFALYQKTVFYALKKVIGIDRGNFFPCAGAPLSDKINEFLQSVDIHILYGYGLSETTATVSCFTYENFKIGTVGAVMPEVYVKISDEGEILVKGKTVMSGYYKRPEETANSFTEDGYFRTGDAGYLTERGELILTERIKDLYKTSNGKYIAPQMIETHLSEMKCIDQVAVIGDERKFVSALIYPNIALLKEYAAANQIEYSSDEDLLAKNDIIKYVYGKIEIAQSSFTSYEKIKRFTLIPQPFDIESGELTNTLKLRRKVIAEHYANEIEEMYRD